MKMATGKEKFYSVGRSEVASQKRSQQLQVWEKSETNKEPDYIVASRQTPKVKFGDNVVFLAAAQSGDSEEVERLIVEEGADVNSVNKDGLTALHQVQTHTHTHHFLLPDLDCHTLASQATSCTGCSVKWTPKLVYEGLLCDCRVRM